MLVTFYKLAMIACINTLVPNRSVIATLLPEHQQMYILGGAMQACYTELEKEREAACTEDQRFCR